MDFSKYKETRQKLAHYDARIDTLNELLKEANQKRQEVCDNCSHDFVFAYERESKVIGHPEQGVLTHASCLVCGQHFFILDGFLVDAWKDEQLGEDEVLVDEWKDEQLGEVEVLDVTLETSEFAQKLKKDGKNVLLLKAEEIFNEYCKMNTMCYSREMILEDIYYKVLELDQYYVNLEAERKQNYEEELAKKKK